MKISTHAVSQLKVRWIIRALAALCSCVAFAPSSSAQAPSAPVPALSALHAVFQLDGPWLFSVGDDPRWADPAFDDSLWLPVNASQQLVDQGIGSYSGYGWYRLRLTPQQLGDYVKLIASGPPVLLVKGNSVGQLSVYVNGIEAGHTRGMTGSPSMYQSLPFIVPLAGIDLSKPIVIAVRSWAGPEIPIRRGLLAGVELGSTSDIAYRLTMTTAQRWAESAASAELLTFLFFSVALLGIALYLAQRHHSEYLWLALLCLSVAAGGAADAALGLAWMPLSVYQVLTLFTGHIFMAVTIEFVCRFSARKPHRAVRIIQISILLLPFLYFLHLTQLYQALSVTAEIVFCTLVCVLLFRAWRGGRGDAGIMLAPFFLAATADSIDTVLGYAAAQHWLPERFASARFQLGPVTFGTGTIAYVVFLGSLLAVILYRFIRVSQLEQRSNAEIAAARSVQALLIPTQLPSTRHFVLESAYLPIHGVGGDFFQVLPLKDDSLLLVVGDVSGKGLQAAMNSSTLVGALRNELSHDPATVLDHLNRVLLGAVSSPGALPELDSAPCFATCLCARIYPDGELIIANAGHLGPYRDGREIELLPGLPLGVIADTQYEQSTFQLNQGDRLVFLSDGVVEAANAEGELFGFERTQQVSNEPARYIAQTAQRFGQTDDITVLSVYVASRTARRDKSELAHLR
jgi:phosphoserine phosphatase RsbU/P